MATPKAVRSRPSVPPAALIVLEAEPVSQEELTFQEEVGGAIHRFVGNFLTFLREAKLLERQAQTSLTLAKTFVLPTSAQEDEQLQIYIRNNNAEKKRGEEHCRITSVVSQFHKRLVAVRTRITAPREEGSDIANRLHNAYVAKERQRVQDEQDRVRRDAEAQAQRDRQVELARLEAEAQAREESSETLSAREQLFVDGYLSGGDAQRAAGLAGFKDPYKQAVRLLATPKILAAIRAKQEAVAIRQQAAAVKEMPLDVIVPDVQANITKAAGAQDRTTRSCEIVDAEAFVKAAVSGTFGIPLDCLMPNPVKLNEMARSLRAEINRWPGVRLNETTKVV